MDRLGLILLLIWAICAGCHANLSKNNNEDDAVKFLKDLDPKYLDAANKQMKTRWDYITNINDQTEKAQIEANLEFAKFQKDAQVKVNDFNWTDFKNEETKRELDYLTIIGSAILDETDGQKFNELQAEMESTYSSSMICPYVSRDTKDCKATLPLDPDLTRIMADSRNEDELKYTWVQWRNVAAKPIRQKYLDFVALNNKAAVANGYPDMGSLWNAYYVYPGYSEEDFKKEIQDLWVQVKPLYVQLYTYVRRILSTGVYKNNLKRFGHLPAHILGDMWAQTWGNIGSLVLPYDAPAVTADDELIKQKYDSKKMFQLAEDFFVGLGLDKMTDTFWSESMRDKPEGREVVCHASAEDFFIGPTPDQREDFRIKMCTQINQEDLVIIHHEMGHIEYFMQYKNQHWVFRNGANPGFHEAIGDTIALSVSTPAHLQSVGLLNPANDSAEVKPRFDDIPKLPEGVTARDMNYLLQQALEKIAFLPFGYLIDKYRWSVFNGETTDKTLNADWWKLRTELQGLVAPVERSEEDFDAGAKYHVAANVEYIRYFISYIVQFQFYEAMCKAAGKYDPENSSNHLFTCDFANSKEAGTKLKDMLTLGFSKPWPEAMYLLTGQKAMNASSLLRYFDPLYQWLKVANEATDGKCVGWENNCAEEPDNTIPIVVGAVLAALIIIVVIAYFIGRSRNRRDPNAVTGSPGPDDHLTNKTSDEVHNEPIPTIQVSDDSDSSPVPARHVGHAPLLAHAPIAAEPESVDPHAESPQDPPAESPEDPPAESPEDPPAESPEDPPAESPEDPPAESPQDSPAESPEDPPAESPQDPPAESPQDPEIPKATDSEPPSIPEADYGESDKVEDTPN